MESISGLLEYFYEKETTYLGSVCIGLSCLTVSSMAILAEVLFDSAGLAFSYVLKCLYYM